MCRCVTVDMILYYTALFGVWEPDCFFFIPCAFFSIFFSLDIGGVHEQTCILARGGGGQKDMN